MKALIITHKTDHNFNPTLLNLFGAVKDIAGESNYQAQTDVLTLGYDLQQINQQIAKYRCVNNVLSIDHPTLEHLLPENIVTQLAEIVTQYTHVLVAADSFGKSLMPRLAGILELGQISEVTAVTSPNIFKRFIYAGNVLLEVESLEDIKLLTIRCGNFSKEQATHENSCLITNLPYTNPVSDKIKLIKKQQQNKSVNLNNAKIVVSGGISLTSKENFEQHIGELAKTLHAAIGATRAAVEAGFASNDCQVGQTGTIVAPEVYLAIGISGAVQHIAGMKDSKTVIAINNDRNAAIFEYADFGLVGDLFDIVPALTNELKAK